MPVNATNVFRQSNAFLFPGHPLAVLVQVTAPAVDLLVTVVLGVIHGAVLILRNEDLAFCAAVISMDTMATAPVAVIGVGCAAVTICVLVTTVMIHSYFVTTF